MKRVPVEVGLEYLKTSREFAEECANRGGYTRRMFKRDRASMRYWAKEFRKDRRQGDRKAASAALGKAIYWRDVSLFASRGFQPSRPRQLALFAA